MEIDPDRDDDTGVADKTPDRWSLTLAIVAVALVAGAAWFRFGPGPFHRPIHIGEPMPPTRLAGLHDPSSRLLLGMPGKVLWLVFLSAEPGESASALPELEAAWNRLRPDRRFGMAVAAVDPAGPERPRAALKSYEGKLPLFLAGREVPSSFGIEAEGPPWHFLIDPHGRVAAVARGAGAETVDRLSKMASEWLGALSPDSDARFFLTLARRGPSFRVGR